ncbi:hypothetical protein CW748_10720 [Alteromonadales bacterium alter-6D02]|nr:hypothetical protein CW748_10720 [Alteromonadales bacterium alter-6D02]
MNISTFYRLTILILCFSSFYLNYMTGDIVYESDLVSAMDWHGYNSQIPHWLTLSIVGPLQLSAMFMLIFNVIAKYLFAILSFILLAFTIYDGVVSYRATEAFVLQMYYLSTGIVLALSFTSLSHKFKLKLW